MVDTKIEFKRMIVGLPHNPRDYSAVSATALLAAQLEIDLVGTFFQEDALARLVDLPDAREFRAMAGWRPLSEAQLAREIEQASNEARRLFTEVTQRHHVRGTFSARKTSEAEAILSQAGQSDIVVIVDPRHPLDRVTGQFRRMVELAFGSTASILIVPSMTESASGRLIAVGSSADDRGVSIAIAIAASTKEPVTIIPIDQTTLGFSPAMDQARRIGVRISITEPMPHGADALSVASSLKGRLLVASRKHISRYGETFLRSPIPMPFLLVQPDISPAIP